MEMDLFVTPEKHKHHPSVKPEKNPVRRKLIVDDDNEIGEERLVTNCWRWALTVQCHGLSEIGRSLLTRKYTTVADKIISDFATIKQNSEKSLNENEVL